MESRYSTREAANKPGIALVTLQGHVKKRTFAAPRLVMIGGKTVRLWTTDDITRTTRSFIR